MKSVQFLNAYKWVEGMYCTRREKSPAFRTESHANPSLGFNDASHNERSRRQSEDVVGVEGARRDGLHNHRELLHEDVEVIIDTELVKVVLWGQKSDPWHNN